MSKVQFNAVMLICSVILLSAKPNIFTLASSVICGLYFYYSYSIQVKD